VLLLVALGALILFVELVRHHGTADVALLVSLFALAVVAGRWLLRDLRTHPTNFPATTGAQDLRLSLGALERERKRA
jgi:uncharacterized membrane protein YqjE